MRKKIISVFLSSSVLSFSFNAHASGIPTVDVANLVQNVMDYAQQLKAYSEDLYQSQVVANEYVQTLKDWHQTLEEWDSQLEQMKGIKDAIDNGEWDKIIGKNSLGFPLDPLDPYWENWDYDKLMEEGDVDISDDIRKFGVSNRRKDDVLSDIDAIYANKSTELKNLQLEQARGKRDWVDSAAQHAQYNKAIAKSRLNRIQEANNTLQDFRKSNAMGEESQLRTLQTLALQNELMADILTAQLELQTEENEFSNSGVFDQKIAEEKAYSYRIKRMREVKSVTPYTPRSGADAHRSATF